MKDLSGMIAVGGTAQILYQWDSVLDKPQRVYIQNLDASETLYVKFGDPASLASADVGSIAIPANSLFDSEGFDLQPAGVTSGACSVFAATAGHKFTAGWY